MKVLAQPRAGQCLVGIRSKNLPAPLPVLGNTPPPPRSEMVIPVVFHVVFLEDKENISDDQILSQLEVLNLDFNLSNTEVATIPAVFKNLAASIDISFCLATTDPQGNPHTGITRTRTSIANIADPAPNGACRICYASQGGADAWDTKRYLNIWVGKFSSFLGEATLPGTAAETEDGIRIDPSVVGTRGSVTPPHHLGRTLTHEVGHYLNLYHTWGKEGDNNLSCLGSDEVDDTPAQAYSYRNECPTHPQVSCGSLDMFMNFMSYAHDACQSMFTAGQKARMMATLLGPRSGLWQSNTICLVNNSLDLPTKVFDEIRVANPVRNDVRLFSQNPHPKKIRVQLYDLHGRKLLDEEFILLTVYTIAVNNLPSGMYLLSVLENSNYIYHNKIIIP